MNTVVKDLHAKQATYRQIAPLLEAEYGRKPWQRHDGMDELISCILSQSTTDANRDRGFEALKKRYSDWAAVHHAPPEELVDTIRPAGLANSKAPYIQGTLGAIYAQFGAYNIDFLETMPVEQAKAWLQSLPGVGPKTAAIVLCFGYNRHAFPVDTHVHRVGQRIGLLEESVNANAAHDQMEAIVPPQEYYAFHLQLIYHGRALCKARSPLCEQCPISQHCKYFRAPR